MTLKEILQGRNYEIVYDELYEKEPWLILDIVDTNTKEKIIRIRGYGDGPEKYTLVVGNKRKTIAFDVMHHLAKEVEVLYKEQEDKKARKKAEEAAAKFEQKKNAVYQDLFNTIKTNVKK